MLAYSRAVSAPVLWTLITAAVIVALWALDRLLLRAEALGWIYYRRRKPSRSALGDAFLAVHSIMEGDKRYVLEARRKQHVEEDGEAGPDDPGRAARATRDGGEGDDGGGAGPPVR
jgi:hypothetical protein